MSSWFSEGTVSVQNGSPTVTGVGTKFSNCRAGDMFVGPDQGIYQVINPASDTSLSISPAYRGPAVGGAGYGIVPVNGYPKALADAVNQMVHQWGATLAGLGDVSTQDVVPVAMGGTGGRNQAEGRAGLGLGSAAAVNIGTDSGNAMPVGAFGLGTRENNVAASMNRWSTGFSIIADQTQYRPVGYGTLLDIGYPGGDLGSQLWMGVSPGGVIGFRSGGYSTATFNTIYHTGNTVRAQDGTLKAI
ncbi:hypothetical protein [Pseudomonas sp. TAE6080]|uniref:hypothetical protein n=1 Tax=Pseudomonas sp. TAE6080 TaxID=2840374 RepID=UPI001BFFFDDB|nr:hypothetical protein [Pseudomonas sp. TAE6080]MBT9303316.1 hypothetical protein [Pseudomonas sp. TAE6080]